MQPPCVVVILPDVESGESPGMQKLDNPEGEQKQVGG